MKLNLSYRNGFFRAQKKRQIDAPNEHPSAAPLSVLPESSALGKFKYRQSCPVGGPSRKKSNFGLSPESTIVRSSFA